MMKSLWLIGTILVMIQVSVLSEEERFKDIDKYVKPADRVLSTEEIDKLVELTIKALQDKDWGMRAEACWKLALDIGHRAAIPVLVRVASNPKELPFVRISAIEALACIADKEVIVQLLKIAEEAIKTKDFAILPNTFYMLHRLLWFPIDFKEKPPKEILDLWKEFQRNPSFEKKLIFYKSLWEWQKDKPIDMRKRVYIMRMRSWH